MVVMSTISITTITMVGVDRTHTFTFHNVELIVTPCLEVVEGHKEVWVIVLLACQQVFLGHPFGTKNIMRGVRQGSALKQGFCNQRKARFRSCSLAAITARNSKYSTTGETGARTSAQDLTRKIPKAPHC